MPIVLQIHFFQSRDQLTSLLVEQVYSFILTGYYKLAAIISKVATSK